MTPEEFTKLRREEPYSVHEPVLRRRFVRNLGLSALGIIGGCSPSAAVARQYQELTQSLKAGIDALNRSREELDRLLEQCEPPVSGENGETPKTDPPECLSEPDPPLLECEKEYAGYLSSLELKHIRPFEIIRPHRNVHGEVANQLPPESIWESIAPTLRVADELRERLGSQLRAINSAYRSPAYNATCPGAARNSLHTKNRALDLVFDCGPKTAFQMAEKIRAEGIFKGGIGLYSSFIHVDTRGYCATWGA